MSGSRTLDQVVAPPSLSVIPRGVAFSARWDAAWTFVVIGLHRLRLASLAADRLRGDPERVELRTAFHFADALLFALGSELGGEALRRNPFGPLYVDSLCCALMDRLLRRYSNGRLVASTPTGRLTARQLRVLHEYLDDHLDQKVTLHDLAACLHLSVPHFERLFQATTRRPPYRYVLDLRLQRAAQLLQEPLALTEIAARCGFTSQSHFTAHFTRRFGVSPARFARRAGEERRPTV
jgi:AraC family transcriptional regulator